MLRHAPLPANIIPSSKAASPPCVIIDLRSFLAFKVSIDDDKRRIEQGMGKCSRWLIGHDQSAACDTPFPAPDELERDIKALDDFVRDVRNRQER